MLVVLGVIEQRHAAVLGVLIDGASITDAARRRVSDDPGAFKAAWCCHGSRARAPASVGASAEVVADTVSRESGSPSRRSAHRLVTNAPYGPRDSKVE